MCECHIRPSGTGTLALVGHTHPNEWLLLTRSGEAGRLHKAARISHISLATAKVGTDIRNLNMSAFYNEHSILHESSEPLDS